MSQHDYNLENQTGLQFRQDLNTALLAVVSNNSGDTEPDETFAFMWWVDTSGSPDLLKMRNAANDGWITIGPVDTANFGFLSLSGGTMTGALLAAAGLLGTPGIAFSGDADTGIYRVSANVFAMVAGGVEILRFASTGAIFQGTGAVWFPSGTDAQRPGTPPGPGIRFNLDSDTFEGYNPTTAAWGEIGGAGARGGGTDKVFFENDQLVTTDYTITTGKNAVSAGPVEVDTGVTVTIPSGSTWTVV